MLDKILINDNRLTPAMKRVRNGRKQLFRELSKDDRSFTISDNSDVILEHENKEMYAELINGKWYWVSGCAECNGKERNFMSYIECEKHDKCSVCSVNRKEIKGPVWGGKKGWTCRSCQKAKELEIRREAFNKLGGKEPDCSYTDEIICPHCGSKIHDSDIHESQDMECSVCYGELSVEVEYTISYSTMIKGERVTK